MKDGLTRKEVWLHEDVVKRLQELADRKKWKLKIYMENALANDSNKAFKIKAKKKL